MCPVVCRGLPSAEVEVEADKQRVTERYTTEAVNHAQHARPAHLILLCSHVVAQTTGALLLKVTCESVRQVKR